MEIKCEDRTPRLTCGILDKDDRTYSCRELCAKGECPRETNPDTIIFNDGKDRHYA